VSGWSSCCDIEQAGDSAAAAAMAEVAVALLRARSTTWLLFRYASGAGAPTLRHEGKDAWDGGPDGRGTSGRGLAHCDRGGD
jgi:hypothetical protein